MDDSGPYIMVAIVMLVLGLVGWAVYSHVQEGKADRAEYAALMARARTFQDTMAVRTWFEARKGRRAAEAATAAAAAAASQAGMRGAVR